MRLGSIRKFYTGQLTFRDYKLHYPVYFPSQDITHDALLDSIVRVLGFTAAKRGRELSGLSPQHDGERFRNVKPRPVEGFGKTWRIVWNVLLNKPQGTVPAGALPVDSLTREQLDTAPDRSLYRLGHSTVLLKLRGRFWLTDPVFAERASPFQRLGPKRFHAPPIALADLPPLAGVILSHDHYDHLDRETVRALAATTKVFVTPLGVGDRLIDWGIDATRCVSSTGGKALKLTASHSRRRRPSISRDAACSTATARLWASWVIVHEDLRVFFSGDTGYFDGFRTIGERLGPFNVTLVETGAYDAQWPYVHMQPEDTVQAHIDLRGRCLCRFITARSIGDARWHEPFERVLGLTAARGIALSTPRMGQRLISPRRIGASAGGAMSLSRLRRRSHRRAFSRVHSHACSRATARAGRTPEAACGGPFNGLPQPLQKLCWMPTPYVLPEGLAVSLSYEYTVYT